MLKAKKRIDRRGNCYVTCEALFHLLGGYQSDWRPATVRHEGDVHWFLVHEHRDSLGRLIIRPSLVLDPTAKQFKTKPPYCDGRGRAFLTKQPSKRARSLMDSMLWQ